MPVVVALAGIGLALLAAVVTVAWCLPTLRLGRIVNMDDLGPVETLASPGLALRGRPDRVYQVRRPWLEWRPGEVKAMAAPSAPRRQDVAQLLGQALLVRDTWGSFPRFGYIIYSLEGERERTFKVRLGPDAEALAEAWLRRLNGHP